VIAVLVVCNNRATATHAMMCILMPWASKKIALGNFDRAVNSERQLRRAERVENSLLALLPMLARLLMMPDDRRYRRTR